jgi:hypothetical protein
MPRATVLVRALPGTIERSWARHGDRLLQLVVLLELAAAVPWLGYQLWRLLSAADPIWPGSPRGAIDLEMLRAAGERWFAGVDPYRPENAAPYPPAPYPPATFLLLWPLLGWLGFAGARWLWAATSLGALVWLSRQLARESAVRGRWQYAAVALLPWALYPAGATIGNGQLGLHVVALLVAAALALERRPPSRARDAVVALAMLGALAKPSLAAPFFWIVLFAPGGLRPAAAIAGGYASLTLAAGTFQTTSLATLLGEWAARAATAAAHYAVKFSHGNLQSWLSRQGLASWGAAAAFVVLAALALWVARYRRADLWLRLGVTALATRLLSYHGWYDDLLLLLPLVALLRLLDAERTSSGVRAAACGLLVAAFPLQLAPGGQYLLPSPWRGLFLTAQLALWIAMLATLLVAARAERGRVEHPTPAL